MTDFTPVSGLIGGAMIGGAAGLLLMVNGRVAGISGIAGGVFSNIGEERQWRLAFLIGLVLGPLAIAALTGNMPAISVTGSWPLLAIGGLLVGFGTQSCRGCTSGHGVCGLARLSPRSLAATATFMAVAAVTVFVVRHLLP
jgi:uncharacterized membrane protein YedE/YeeE